MFAGGAWAGLAERRFVYPEALMLHEEALLLVDSDDRHVSRLQLSDGAVLARSPALDDARVVVVGRHGDAQRRGVCI